MKNSNSINKEDHKSLDKEMISKIENNNRIDDYLYDMRLKKEEEKMLKLRNEKEKKINSKNKDFNQDSKKFIEENHIKTHFKAVTTIAIDYKETGILL